MGHPLRLARASVGKGSRLGQRKRWRGGSHRRYWGALEKDAMG